MDEFKTLCAEIDKGAREVHVQHTPIIYAHIHAVHTPIIYAHIHTVHASRFVDKLQQFFTHLAAARDCAVCGTGDVPSNFKTVKPE